MTLNPEKRVAELETIIASAIQAIHDGRRGDALKLLKTGNAKVTTTGSAVLAHGVTQ